MLEKHKKRKYGFCGFGVVSSHPVVFQKRGWTAAARWRTCKEIRPEMPE
jgi:hypothetical protein